MAIRDNQRRVTIIMNKDDYEKVERAAKEDRRSVSSYCNNIIMSHIESNYRESHKVSFAKNMKGVSVGKSAISSDGRKLMLKSGGHEKIVDIELPMPAASEAPKGVARGLVGGIASKGKSLLGNPKFIK